MKTIKSTQRGHSQFDWLNSYHVFSFGNFYEPKQMGYSYLRVLNDDIIQPTKGFGMHPHKNMEIFSYVHKGTLEHQDSLGNKGTVGNGKAQLMSAGSGILHSEFNPSETKPSHLIQVWIEPSQQNTQPLYQEKELPTKGETPRLLFSPDGRENSMTIKQNAWLYNIHPNPGSILLPKPKETSINDSFLYIVNGSIEIADQRFPQGTSLMDIPDSITIKDENTDLLWFLF